MNPELLNIENWESIEGQIINNNNNTFYYYLLFTHVLYVAQLNLQQNLKTDIYWTKSENVFAWKRSWKSVCNAPSCKCPGVALIRHHHSKLQPADTAHRRGVRHRASNTSRASCIHHSEPSLSTSSHHPEPVTQAVILYALLMTQVDIDGLTFHTVMHSCARTHTRHNSKIHTFTWNAHAHTHTPKGTPISVKLCRCYINVDL